MSVLFGGFQFSSFPRSTKAETGTCEQQYQVGLFNLENKMFTALKQTVVCLEYDDMKNMGRSTRQDTFANIRTINFNGLQLESYQQIMAPRFKVKMASIQFYKKGRKQLYF